MTDNQILQEYVRVRVTPARIFIEVKHHEEDEAISTRWSLAAALPLQSTRMQVDRVRMMTLADYRYFRVCDTCGERHPRAEIRAVGDGSDVCRECEGEEKSE